MVYVPYHCHRCSHCHGSLNSLSQTLLLSHFITATKILAAVTLGFHVCQDNIGMYDDDDDDGYARCCIIRCHLNFLFLDLVCHCGICRLVYASAFNSRAAPEEKKKTVK